MKKNNINTWNFESLSLSKLNNDITKAINDFAKIQEMRFFLYDYQDVLEKIIYFLIRYFHSWEQKDRKILNSQIYSIFDSLALKNKEKNHIISFVSWFLKQDFNDKILDWLDMQNKKLEIDKEVFSGMTFSFSINSSNNIFLSFIFDIYSFFIKNNDRDYNKDNYESYINIIITDYFSWETKEFRKGVLKLWLYICDNLEKYKKTINYWNEYFLNNFENIIIIILGKCKFENIILKKKLKNSINLSKDILKKITNILENLSSQK